MLNRVGSVVWRVAVFLPLSVITEPDDAVAAALSKASCFDCCLAVKRLSVGAKLPSVPFCWPLITSLSLSLLTVGPHV